MLITGRQAIAAGSLALGVLVVAGVWEIGQRLVDQVKATASHR